MFTSTHIVNVLTESPFLADDVPTVYCDVDGVLANFYAGMEKYLNIPEHSIEEFLSRNGGWSYIEQQEPHLFAKLPLLPDAKGLIQGLIFARDSGKINLFILTAIPEQWYHSSMRHSATQDKVTWITRHFQKIPAKNVIVVRRQDKQTYAKTHAQKKDAPPVLIDDFGKNIREWEHAGGFGIKHLSGASSLRALYTYLE